MVTETDIDGILYFILFLFFLTLCVTDDVLFLFEFFVHFCVLTFVILFLFYKCAFLLFLLSSVFE